MAYAPSRSCNDELLEGATDGGVWKRTPNRGGLASSPSNQEQANLNSLPTAMRGVIGQKWAC